MQMYDDLVELARICVRQACGTKNKVAAAELMRMAKEFQHRAAKLNPGKLPRLGGESPASVGGGSLLRRLTI